MPPKGKVVSKRKAAPVVESRKKIQKRAFSEDSDEDDVSPPVQLAKELEDDEGNPYWEVLSLNQFASFKS